MACRATVCLYDEEAVEHVCGLPEGHDGRHRDGDGSWEDHDPDSFEYDEGR